MLERKCNQEMYGILILIFFDLHRTGRRDHDMLTFELQERGICLLAECNRAWTGRCYCMVTAKGCCRVRQAVISSIYPLMGFGLRAGQNTARYHNNSQGCKQHFNSCL